MVFSTDNGMSDTLPVEAGEDKYDVDFSATTREFTRWSTQFGPTPRYRNRAEQDKKLLTYTSEPMKQDMELTGTPVIKLFVKTKTSDPVFFVYLEDVAPTPVALGCRLGSGRTRNPKSKYFI